MTEFYCDYVWQGVTHTAVDSYDEYWQHYKDLQKEEATHMYQFYKKQLQILAYNQSKDEELFSFNQWFCFSFTFHLRPT